MNDYVVTFLRALLAFITLFILVRLVGRKQISQLTFADYVVGIVLGTLAGSLTLDKSVKIIDGIVALTVWSGLAVLTGSLSLKNLRFRKIIIGEPLIVIGKGKVHDQNMQKAKYSISDLLMQLREKDVFDISKVDYAVLEPNGQLSVLKKAEHIPLTPKDMGLATTPQGLIAELVVDGRIFKNQLVKLKKNETWLRGELGNRGISDLDSVIFAGLLPNGQLYAATRQGNQ